MIYFILLIHKYRHKATKPKDDYDDGGADFDDDDYDDYGDDYDDDYGYSDDYGY